MDRYINGNSRGYRFQPVRDNRFGVDRDGKIGLSRKEALGADPSKIRKMV